MCLIVLWENFNRAYASAMTVDAVVIAAKIMGSVFAGLYGLYATVTDFHTTSYGKQRLSKKGKWGLTLLLLATVISVTSDGVKQKIDLNSARAESKRRDAETARIQAINAQVDRQLAESASMSLNLKSALDIARESNQRAAQNIAETHRLLDPIQDSMLAELYLSLPVSQPLVEPYVSRIKGSNFSLRPDQPYFPKSDSSPTNHEREIYEFVTSKVIQIIFRGAAGAEVVVFRMECHPPYDYLDQDTELTLGAGNLQMMCRSILNRSFDDGSFRSYTDLLNAEVLVLVQGAQVSSQTDSNTSHLRFNLDRIVIRATNAKYGRLWSGRKLRLDYVKRTKRGPEDAYVMKASMSPLYTARERHE
jgi:hypothetical protein